ncbi:HD domain-containing protein [Furfurilactobacillus siliginis]|uniref:Hydrolase n=1 Tax=Furfurilactobacillus siliginis TaxID=348151 RepID=A0A0R2LB71_9LACO|nr:HD domain-containing protein [Furfurilactobacillus siliginis]KRN95975.1 hydrolase [Furfurilactobacillus siliginis]GEK29165.1 phosphohydrolase [Furfurilactobacillus siliginis]
MDYRYQTFPREKVFRDPVHNYIAVSHQVILDLINTKEFQRLRRVKQLGVTAEVFHGAEHSRFGHSLGVYEIARRICDNFAADYPSVTPDDGLWNDDERLVTLCAALLHDIGHGAYSHTFEHIFHTDHEAITMQILTSPNTEVNKVLRRVSPEFPQQVASVINHTYPNPQVVQIISSQLDADRMDYLLRDAYFTGADYGRFDLTRVLRVMRPFKDGIAFDIDGMHAVEDYILSRFQMYQQIYFHPVSRAMEVILDHLLLRAKDLYTNKQAHHETFSPILLEPFFNEDWTLKDYLKLDDGVLNTYFQHWQDSSDVVLSDLATRFLDRKPFKSVEYNADTEDLLPTLRDQIETAGYNVAYYTATNDSYDLPYNANTRQSRKPAAEIQLMKNDGSTIELSALSPLVAAISGRELGDQRFFFPREMYRTDTAEDLFMPIYTEFQAYIKNNQLIHPKGEPHED